MNNLYREQLVDAGLVVSGTFEEGRLVEIVELPDHPWFVASQFHPEFKSRPTRPAPLFRGFVAAALERPRSRAGAAVAASTLVDREADRDEEAEPGDGRLRSRGAGTRASCRPCASGVATPCRTPRDEHLVVLQRCVRLPVRRRAPEGEELVARVAERRRTRTG